MKKLLIFVLLGGFVLPSASLAIDLKQAKFTQVVNSVDVITPSDQARHAAEVNDIFKMPDVLRTGPSSRAELVATDNTITRVGANTVFSFDPASRTIDLQQGSLLFHSPHGKGGGTIHTGSATASVLGTTIIVTTTPNGGFKVLVLEGEAEIRFLNGLHLKLTPGQMTFVLPGGGTSPIVVFRLDDETKGSLLVNGFDNPLPSLSKIQTEITRQLLLLLNNRVQDVDLVVGDNATPNAVQVRMEILSPPTPPSTPFDTDSSIIGTDHTPHQPLPVDYPPLEPAHVEPGSFTPPALSSFTEGLEFLGIVNPITGGSPASGFVGKNVDIDTANVDLSSFAGKPDFDIMAAKDLRVWQSVNFTPSYNSDYSGDGGVVTIGIAAPAPLSLNSGQPDTISLFAGGQMLIAPDSTLEADTKLFGLVADSFGTLNISDGTVAAPKTLENVSIYNNVGDVDVLSLSDLTIEGLNSGDTVYAGGNVNIQSDGILTIGTDASVSQLNVGYNNVLIDAGGDVGLSAGLTSGGNLNVEDAAIYAGDDGLGASSYSGGSLNLNAGGDVYVYGSSLYAYGGEVGTGDVNIFGVGTVDVEDTYIYAGGDANFESGNTLYLGWFDGGYNEIDAYGSVYLTSDSADVKIYGYDIYAYGNSANITAAGNVDVESSDIYAAGDVNISSGGAYVYQTIITSSGDGDVYISDSDIYAGYDSDFGGSVHIAAGGNVTILNSGVYAYDDVNITSEGTIATVGDSTVSEGNGIDIEDSTIYAGWDSYSDSIAVDGESSYDGGSVNINASAGNVYLYDDDIEAYSGESTASGYVNIYGSGTVDMEDTYISADNDVNIESGDTLTLNFDGNYYNEIDAGGSVYLTSDNADVDVYNYDIYANDGTVSISAGGDADVEGNDIEAWNGGVSINATGNVTVDNNQIYAYDGGDININSEGTIAPNLEGNISGGGYVDLEDNNEIYAYDGGVNISAYGYVYAYNNDIEADNGDLDINSYSSTVDIEDTYLYASGDVNIESDGTLTLGSIVTESSSGSNGDTIEADGGVNLTSDSSDVDVYDTEISAYGGDVKISAGGSVDMEDNGFVQAYGNVDVTASGDVYICGTPISATGTILTGETISGDEVSISGGGTVTIWGNYGDNYIGENYLGYDIGADTTVCIWGSTEVNIYDAVIETLDGSSSDTVEVYSGGPIYLGSDTINSYGGVTVSGDGDVTLDSTDINAGGDVYITSSGTVGVSEISTVSGGGNVIIQDGSDIEAGGGVNVTTGSGDVDVYDSTVSANGGDLDVTGGGNLNMNNATVNAYDDVNANMGGNIDITYSGGDVGGSVNLTAGGYVNVYQDDTVDSALVLDDWNVTAGAYVTLGADDYVQIYNSDIEADGGDVSINAYNGTADIEDTFIQASGDVVIESWDTLTLGNSSGDTIDAGGGVSLTSDNGDVDVYESGIYAYAGDVDIAAGGNVNVENTVNIYAAGNVNINSEGTVSIESPNFVSGGGVDIENSYISAGYDYNNTAPSLSGGSVNINAYDGNVYLGSDVVYAYGGDSTGSGNVEIYGSGNVDVLYSDVSQDGSVNVNAGGYVHLYDVYDNNYDGNGGDVYLTDWSITAGSYVDIGADSNVQIYNSDIEADGGDVSINAGYYDYNGSESVTLGGDDINAENAVTVNAPGDVEINNTTINAGADVTGSAGGSLDVENSSVEAAGAITLVAGADANITDTGLSATGGDLIVDAGGDLSIDEEGSVSYPVFGNNVSFTGGQSVTISGAIINAKNGDLTINAGNSGEDLGFIAKHIASVGRQQVYPAQTFSSVDGVSISAGGDVNITEDGYILIYQNPVPLVSNGNIDIEDMIIENPAVNIETANGYVYISGSTLTADTGDVNISGSGDVSVYDTTIGAFGNVDISSGGTLTLGTLDDVAITAAGYINLSAAGDADISYTTFTANGADLNNISLSIASGGSVDMENSTVNIAGAMKITADGNITVLDVDGSVGGSTTLSADGFISVHNPELEMSDWNVYAGTYASLVSDDSVQISDSDIEANGGDVSITAQGTGSSVDIEGSYIYASGDVNIESSDTLMLGNTSGNTIQANGAVSLISDNSDVDVYDYTIYSYGANSQSISTGISAAGNVYLSGDSIYSYGGEISITALGSSSTIDIEDTYIYTGNEANIESTGTLTLNTEDSLNAETIEAGGSVYLTSDSSDVDVNNYRMLADYGNVTLNSDNGNIDFENSYVEANGSGNGSVSLTGYADVYLGNDNIYADTGDITISSVGSVFEAVNETVGVDIEDSELYADEGKISINANGFVYALNDDIEAGSGGLNIDSYDSTIDIEDSYLYASGDVSLESSGTLTLNAEDTEDALNADTVEAGGSVYLISGAGDVDIYNYNVYAYGGLLSINAASGNVDIENSILGAGTGSYVNITGSTLAASQNVYINAYGGNIEINAGNNLTILNTTFNLGGNITISGSSVTADNGSVEIASDGTLSISDEGTEVVENISGNQILGDNITISSSIITANGGDIDIANNNNISVPDIVGFDLSPANDIEISSSILAANTGNVNISTDGGVDLENSSVSASGSAGITGNVTVNAGAGITVNGTSISGDATAGTIALNNTSGQTTIQNGSSLQAFYINVNSPDGILIDGTGGGHLSGNTMNLTAGMGDASGGPTTTIQNEDLGNLTIVNVQSHTANFDDDNFSSTSSYNVTVWNHDYHINDGHVPGSANFNNDTLDHSTSIINTGTAGLANQPNNGGIMLGGSGSGIHIN